MSRQDKSTEHLPACVVEYINHVIRRMRYSRAARRDVRQELVDHFTDALAEYSDPQERQKIAEELIAEFGDVKLLATLIRRAKKRNRPLWKKAIIRALQGILVLIGLFILYTAWFFTGKPTITTNYMAVLNEKMQAKAPESENAWPMYREAILHFVRPAEHVTGPTGQPVYKDVLSYMDVDIAHAPDFLQDAARKCIAENEKAWQDYAAASTKPYCWFDVSKLEGLQRDMMKAEASRRRETLQPETATTEPEDAVWKGSLMTTLLPHLGPMRPLAKIGVLRAHFATAEGNVDGAMEDALTVARVARHWQNPEGHLISQLVGTAISELADEEIRRLSGQKALTSAAIRQAQEQFEGLYPDGYPTFGIESERIAFADTVQRAFTDGGPGGGHIIPKQAWFLLKETGGLWPDTGHYEKDIGLRALMAASFLLHAGRDDTLTKVNEYYDYVAQWCKMTPYQRTGKANPDKIAEQMARQQIQRYLLLVLYLPSFTKASEHVWQGWAEYEATLAVLGLRRYCLDKGEYPASLEALVASGYLRQVPMDPYSDKPLVYRRVGNDFTLYSVGADFHDDGGQENPKEPWGTAPSATSSQPKGSDRVFWPVAPLKPFVVDEQSSQPASGR